jgi:hypothetical protein
MPFNSFSVGKDVSLDLIGYTGGIVTPHLIKMFNSKQLTNQIRIMGLDGIPRFLELPHGWDGTFELDRADSTLDDYFAGLEAAYYQGLNVLGSFITETITEPLGNITQYRYQGVMFRLEDAGAWHGDNSVTQRLGFIASQRIKVL